ncbi:hypothetical protein Tco_0305531 [Tanacetum coccineum]
MSKAVLGNKTLDMSGKDTCNMLNVERNSVGLSDCNKYIRGSVNECGGLSISEGCRGSYLDESLETLEHLRMSIVVIQIPLKNVTMIRWSPSSLVLREEDVPRVNLEDDAGEILGVHSQVIVVIYTTDDNEDVYASYCS